MKVAVVRTYDVSAFNERIEEYYEKYNIDHVDTHTAVFHQGELWYIAIIFYKSKVGGTNENNQ